MNCTSGRFCASVQARPGPQVAIDASGLRGIARNDVASGLSIFSLFAELRNDCGDPVAAASSSPAASYAQKQPGCGHGQAEQEAGKERGWRYDARSALLRHNKLFQKQSCTNELLGFEVKGQKLFDTATAAAALATSIFSGPIAAHSCLSCHLFIQSLRIRFRSVLLSCSWWWSLFSHSDDASH